jgi:radical SAM superfamily enzyme YgiQ (UPF0313 family)
MAEGTLYRPPSEANSYILQATIGCSWNKCTYCDMYREKTFRLRDVSDCLAELREVGSSYGNRIDKLFIADGDPLVMPMEHWLPILQTARQYLPNLRQISCYALASNVLEKTPEQLKTLRENGLSLLYIGPESGDEITLKRIAKGLSAADHVQAAEMAHTAGMALSVIVLLGVGGIERSQAHAQATAELITAMKPEFLAALTTMIIPNTPLYRMEAKGLFKLPPIEMILQEIRTIVAQSQLTHTVFRTNHASNYLPLGGILPNDRQRIVETINQALSGKVSLRPESRRRL